MIGSRTLLPLAIVALASFGAVYAIVFHAPMWTDDIQWTIQNARVPYDAYRMINLYPVCLSNANWSVPWPLLPGRVFTGLISPDTLVGLRLYGMAKYLACILLLAGWAWFLFEKTGDFVLWIAVSAGLLSLGFLPAIMTFNRPETAIFIGVGLLYMLIPLSHRATRAWMLYAIIAAFLLILSWFLSIHPKMQLFLPMVVAIAFALRTPNVVSRITLLGMTLLLVIGCVLLWKDFTNCSDSRNTQQHLAVHSLLPQKLFNHPDLFVKGAVKNLGYMPKKLLQVGKMSSSYLNIPQAAMRADTEHPAESLVSRVVKGTMVALVIGLGLSLLASPLILIRGNKPIIAVHHAWLMLIPLVGITATKRTSLSFHEMGLLWPLLLLALVILIAGLGWHRRRWWMGVVMFVLAVSIASHIVFYTQWNGFYRKTGDPAMYPNGQIHNILFQTIFDEPARAQSIHQAAAACGIATDQSARHVVVDDQTYMAMRKTFQPYYYWMPLLHWPARRRQSITEFLEEMQSSGAVALCEHFPSALRNQTLQVNGICCLRPKQME